MRFVHQQTKEEVLEAFAAHVSPARVALFQKLGADVVPGLRDGAWIWDLEGRRYLNCRTSGGVFNLGHRPRPIVRALKAALDEVDMGDHMLLSELRARFAARLTALARMQFAVLGATGSEANDVALKVCRAVTGRRRILSARGAYHGHTGLALAAGDLTLRELFRWRLPDFQHVPFGDAAALEAALEEGDVAAVILETIPVVSGVQIPPDGYLAEVRRLCDAHGALLIFDEVQAGLSRTGRLWAWEHWGVRPDVMVLGKGLSGGVYPLSAALFTDRFRDFFEAHPFFHLSSYGGSDLGSAVGLALLEEIARPQLLENVRARGEQLGAGLKALAEAHPQLIAAVRGLGLLWGVEMTNPLLGPALSAALALEGVIANFSGNAPQVLILMPPLTVAPEEIDFLLTALEGALARLPEVARRLADAADALEVLV